MTNGNETTGSVINAMPPGEWHLGMFEKSEVARRRLRLVEDLLGITLGLDCLAISGDAAIHYYLRAHGGAWQSVDFSESGVRELRAVLTCPPQDWEPPAIASARQPQQARLVEEGRLPFPDLSFDRIVLLGGLEQLEDDYAFIAECHRVLKESGHLILNTTHAKRWTLLAPVRRLLGLSEDTPGVRKGYTQHQLFSLLKDGFDVQRIQGYTRFFSLCVESLIEFAAGFLIRTDEKGMVQTETFERIYRLVKSTCLLNWLASKLDGLLFFTRGYRLIVKAERRIWRPRRAPILVDGRSIAEATLQTRIGTAGPLSR